MGSQAAFLGVSPEHLAQFHKRSKKYKALAAISFFLISSPIFPATSSALQIPDKPQAYVNDYAHLLSDNARVQIENTLAEFEKSTSTQIVVAIFPSLEGEALEDYSIRLAEKWKIGSKKNNNGIILLIFKEDRKVRIEVGYGLEGALPDLVSDQIIRTQIKPAFREGDFDKGVSEAVQAIIQATRGEYKTPAGTDHDPLQKYGGILFLLLIIYLVAPIICYAGVMIGCVAIFGVSAGLFTGLVAVFLLFILRQFFSTQTMGKTFGSRGGYWGGGFGGGSSGGGFSGGFGGGGGGSFGGGGASGGW